MVKKGPESRTTLLLLNDLRKAKRPVWSRVAELVRKPRRKAVEVNLGRLSRVTHEGSVVVVPGKIVSGGSAAHKMTLGYVAATQSALVSLKQSGVNALPLSQFLKKHAKDKDIQIVI